MRGDSKFFEFSDRDGAVTSFGGVAIPEILRR
jgi:hypothetical protein